MDAPTVTAGRTLAPPVDIDPPTVDADPPQPPPPPPEPPLPPPPPHGAPTIASGTKKKGTLAVFGEGTAHPTTKKVSMADLLAGKTLKNTEKPSGKDSGLGPSPVQFTPPGDPVRPHHTKEQAEAFRAIESVGTYQRHPANYRSFPIEINGKPMLIAVMAHPKIFGTPNGDGIQPHTGIDSKIALEKMLKAGFTSFIALEESDSHDIRDQATEIATNLKIPLLGFENLHVEDFTGTRQRVLDQAYSIAAKTAEQGGNLAIYCGAGFGRSGTVAASIFLTQNLINQHRKKGKLKATGGDTTAKLYDQFFEEVLTTIEVARAVEFVRREDPETGVDLTAYNANSSEIGPTVETEDQFEALEILEERVRAKFC